LASIAAIAHVEMKTKQDQEELGTQIVEGSKFVSQEVVLPKGLHLRSKSVFNIPARRNFFKVGYG
jgi:DNA mismatch repair protein MutL